MSYFTSASAGCYEFSMHLNAKVSHVFWNYDMTIISQIPPKYRYVTTTFAINYELNAMSLPDLADGCSRLTHRDGFFFGPTQKNTHGCRRRQTAQC